MNKVIQILIQNNYVLVSQFVLFINSIDKIFSLSYKMTLWYDLFQ